MKRHHRIFVGAVAALLTAFLAATFFLPPQERDLDPVAAYSRLGKGGGLVSTYRRWSARHEKNGGDGNVTIPLAWSKAFSRELSRGRGTAVFDLIEGSVSVEVFGLEDAAIADVWLVDNLPGAGRSARPEAGDRFLQAGTLRRGQDRAILHAYLGDALRGFEVDLVVVARAGSDPAEAGVLFGAPGLFQRLCSRSRRGDASMPPARLAPAARDGLPTASAGGAMPELGALAAEGARLFFEETFEGNGRTCGTCHPAENNLTIDPEFIATLPAKDPLFVAELLPELAKSFEKPELMRKAGLILENLDGFGDLEHRFVMRGVPHTLALSTSLAPAPDGADGSTIPPAQRTGWSGDGAPGGGTLREFALGAVRQHFTRSLGRKPDIDFRFPTDEELDALEAFQLTLGRSAEIDLPSLDLKGELAARGKDIFLATDTEGGTRAAGKCNNCHANAGASFALQPGALNFNFDTGVEALPDQPADLIDAAGNPPDGGFGTEPAPDRPGAFGNGTFNTPSLIEAADTGPFFHSNAVATLEEAVGFYNGDAFNSSPAGRFLASLDSGGIGIALEATQVSAIAALLRVLNALENIRSASELADCALGAHRLDDAAPLILLAAEEATDASEVLDCGGLHPQGVGALREAVDLLRAAARTYSARTRGGLIEDAIDRLLAARGDMVAD